MHNLPTNQEEFTMWKLNGGDVVTGSDESVQNNDEIWQWIIQYGGPLFSEHIRFRVETDAGHGGECHVVFFDEQVISVTFSQDLFGKDYYTVYTLYNHFTCDVPTEHVMI